MTRKWKLYQAINELHMRELDYPGDTIAAYGGIPPNTTYNYVSSTFLEGLVNYSNIKRAFIIGRYGLEESEWTSYQLVAAHVNAMSHFHDPGADDVIMFGQTETCFWWYWFDRDVSDCNVTRADTDLFEDDFELFVQSVIDYMNATRTDWCCPDISEPIFFPIQVNGWITW